MAEHEWGERLQAHLDELEQLREKMQARQEQLEQRVAALEAQYEIVVDLMTQVADMLDEWQALGSASSPKTRHTLKRANDENRSP